MDAQRLMQNMRLTVCIDFNLFICECTFEGCNQMATLFHIIGQCLKIFFLCTVERRKKDDFIVAQIFSLRRYDIKFNIQAIQCICKPAQHTIISMCILRIHRELNQTGIGAAVCHDCHAIVLFQVHQMLPDALPFISDDCAFSVGFILLQIMRQHTLPIAFDCIMNRMPMPVFDHIGSICDMRICTESQLSRIREPSQIALCFCLEYQIVV